MPIWGGASSDKILGRAGDDNLIHGAEGDDLIFSLGLNDSIYGDNGIDTVVFSGNFSDYSILSYSDDGAQLSLGRLGFEKSLYDVEFLQFDDMTIATSAVPEPSTVLLLGTAVVAVAFRFRRLVVR